MLNSPDGENTVSYNAGQDYKDILEMPLYSTWIFVGNKIVIHQRKLEHILSILAKIGGLFCSLMAGCKAIIELVNKDLHIDKLIRQLYFVKLKDTED